MVKKVVTNLDSSVASGLDCFPVVLNNCELEFSYIEAKLFNMCLNMFQIVGRSHQ